jgi:hypothetical protein
MSEHKRYLNLCTAYALGTITDQDLEALERHLKRCPHCRDLIQECEEVVALEIPLGAPEFGYVPENSPLQNAMDGAHQRVLQRIGDLDERRGDTLPALRGTAKPKMFRRLRWAIPAIAAVMVVIGAFVFFPNQRPNEPEHEFTQSLGNLHRGADRDKMQVGVESNGFHPSVDELQQDREQLRMKLGHEEHSLQQLQQQLQQRDAETAELKNQLRTSTETVEHLHAQLGQEQAIRVELGEKLADTKKSLQEVEEQLKTTVGERANYMATAASLEQRLGAVSQELKEKTNSLEQQAELLSHDRDIRDVIGARDLYVAEVNDVGRDAKTKEPFGRVFFTKGKSLIFYAYDLERQGRLEKAGTFQAWGRRGRDFSQALPLGIMYLDSSSKRRWVLRLDNPTTLAKIDAVFVTVEPAGGSERPTGKPLLFAYLKIEPNHP